MSATDLTWANVLTGLVNGNDLNAEVAEWAMSEILSGKATEVQIAGFAVALRAKGETVDEIAGLADGMLANAVPVELDRNTVDVVGSGGDRSNTVNISTMAAIVAAAAGAKVAKHGNRAASSKSGAADCLEALGVRLDVPPQAQSEILDATGIVFLFAPQYHPSLRHAGPARKQLGIQTTFNFLGPLANPARPKAQALGVANETIAPLVAGVLARRGTQGLVFRGYDGLDELTTTTASKVWIVTDGEIEQTQLNPAELGLRPASVADLTGGESSENARVVRQLVEGKPGPVKDIVVLNAAAALLAHNGPQLGVSIVDQLSECIDACQHAIESGRAHDTLMRWISVSENAAQVEQS